MPRKTSDVTVPFPFVADTTAFILVLPEGSDRGYEHASTHAKKADLLNRAIEARDWDETFTLLAVWPGAIRTDVFEVDDLNEAIAGFEGVAA